MIWQPAETAPKDGSWVLTADADFPDLTPDVLWWDSDLNKWTNGEFWGCGFTHWCKPEIRWP